MQRLFSFAFKIIKQSVVVKRRSYICYVFSYLGLHAEETLKKEDENSGSSERKSEKKDETNDSKKRDSKLKIKDKTLKTGGFQSRFVIDKSVKKPVEKQPIKSKIKKKKQKVIKPKPDFKDMVEDEKIASEIESSQVKVEKSGGTQSLEGVTQSLEKHAKIDADVIENREDAKDQTNKSSKKGKRKRKVLEGDDNTVAKKKRRKHVKKKSSDASQAGESKGERAENERGVAGSLDENDTSKRKLNKGEVVAKRQKKIEEESGKKIKKNNKKDKSKGKRKQSTKHADKRSGVLAIEVVKSKIKKKAAERGHLFEKEQSYDFGTGDDVGW